VQLLAFWCDCYDFASTNKTRPRARDVAAKSIFSEYHDFPLVKKTLDPDGLGKEARENMVPYRPASPDIMLAQVSAALVLKLARFFFDTSVAHSRLKLNESSLNDMFRCSRLTRTLNHDGSHLP
jgi:hypothetical protein